MISKGTRQKTRSLLAVLGIAVTMLGTGCQVHMGGQTLPSPYYLQDDVQYFAPGPEFKLANEAAAIAADKENTISTEQR